jgi:hypothetical protein
MQKPHNIMAIRNRGSRREFTRRTSLNHSATLGGTDAGTPAGGLHYVAKFNA